MKANEHQINSYTLSHRGLVRENNEDRVHVSQMQLTGGKSVLLAVLADGVGGHQAGEVASRIAVETISKAVKDAFSKQDPHDALTQAIQSANQAILDDMALHPEHAGMGTTCVCALIIGRALYAVHLGDSRLYLHRKSTLYQLTRDHTMLEEMQEAFNSAEDGITRSHPMAHVLSRYLGSTKTLEIDHTMLHFANHENTITLQAADTLLLCSDGISDMVADTEIARILETCDGRKRAQSLVYHALENGGHDNASAIVLHLPH